MAKKVEEKEKNKGGRPTMYTPELGKQICEDIASSSHGIKQLCRENPHWPSHDTIYKWLVRHPEFADYYTNAKRAQITVFIDEIIEIADNDKHDKMINEHDKEVANYEYISRSRLRIDTRKWLACKLVPRIYGAQKEEEEKESYADQLKELE